MAVREPWHLDRRVPIALIIAIFVQTAGAGFYVARMDSRIEQNTRDIQELKVTQEQDQGNAERRFKLIEDKLNSQGETLARMEERFIAAMNSLNRIETRLEKLP